MGEDDELLQFATDLQQDVLSRSETEGEEAFVEGVFTQVALDCLSNAGDLDDAELCSHRAHGLQVNGWAVSGDDECLDLLVTVYTGEVPPRTVTKEEMSTAFKRLKQFAAKAFAGYQFEVEESTAVFDAAQRIHEISRSITRIRFFLVTDGIIKSEPPRDADMEQYHVTHQVWDLERFYRLWSSGREREAVSIDFEEITGAAVPCLVQPQATPEYSAYLAIFPATALADLYGRYGPRLLERNVRSFLQARGKINSGIRRTIMREPQMFLAFNNGLSATAESVELVDLPCGGKGIKSARDLQIVNGGQTTASIYHASKKDKADLSTIFVQVKLTVLSDPGQMDAVVPRISEYANSQNKIQTADFAANDVYHRRMEELSRTIWAPARSGSLRQSHWYYERARGQYQDALARERTPGQKKTYQSLNPPAQLFTKTDMAKFISTWSQFPHMVSRGAQSCFNDFTVNLEKHVEQNGPVDQAYFERVMAQAILFRTAERIMKACGYAGYRANLVTYTLARLAHDTKGKIDLSRIWREQATGEALEGAVAAVSRFTWDHITNAPNGGNVTQYCKKEDCWLSFLSQEIPLPAPLRAEIGEGARRSGAAGGRTDNAETPPAVGVVQPNGLSCVAAETWLKLGDWAHRKQQLTGLQRKIVVDLAAAAGYGQPLNQRQIKDGTKILAEAVNLGFRQ